MGCAKLATLRDLRMDIGDFVLASVCVHLHPNYSSIVTTALPDKTPVFMRLPS